MNKSFKMVKDTMTSVTTSKTVIVVCILLVALIVYYHVTQSNRSMEQFENKEERESASEDELVPKNGSYTVAGFFAEWCPHCVKFKPTFNKEIKPFLEGLENPKINVVAIDADEKPELVEKYEIGGFPTMIIIDSHGQSTEYEGDRSAEGIKKFIDSLSK